MIISRKLGELSDDPRVAVQQIADYINMITDEIDFSFSSAKKKSASVPMIGSGVPPADAGAVKQFYVDEDEPALYVCTSISSDGDRTWIKI